MPNALEIVHGRLLIADAASQVLKRGVELVVVLPKVLQ
jgi:hypothetical protein